MSRPGTGLKAATRVAYEVGRTSAKKYLKIKKDFKIDEGYTITKEVISYDLRWRCQMGASSNRG